MLAESYLRTRTRIALYLATLFLLLFMSVQNVRYGLYDLFYMSILLAPAMLFGAIYAWARRSDLNAYGGHLAVLTVMLVVVALQLSSGQKAIVHWLYGIGLFSFLLLPLRPAFTFNIVTLLISSVALSYSDSFYSTLRFATSYALLVGLAGVYAYLYHHKSRFLVHASIKDPHTGAYNQKHLEFSLKQEISRSEATSHPLSLVVLEIDFFDQQREVQGQNFINELLSQFGAQLLQMTRAGDSIYYVDNGRFFIMLPMTPEEGLLVIAERLRRSVEERTWPIIDSLTVSVGCLTRKSGETDDQALTDRALTALKQAQQSGHNRVVLSKSK
ncbi:GGDEF domain-containing protein [Hahella aquimaris]|uniref:GGDEF domain-containing protein n=1 Tax=Hahella sp. HNIBRBA332 TaxID=3015983 RepID=UPI00273C4ACD|nr:GGDEF domain-containing protein [Hahella sp. HNIBRBA332]WLQ14135.1 GGDEF domain-containing protein [Hahella sp. HNIBRBA332]